MNANYVYDVAMDMLNMHCAVKDMKVNEVTRDLVAWSNQTMDLELANICKLIAKAKEEIAKKGENGNAIPALKKLFKICQKHNREMFRRTWIADGKQIMTDSIFLLILDKPMDIFTIQDAVPLDYHRVADSCEKYTDEVVVDMAEIQMLAKENKALKRKQFSQVPGYELWVNPELMYDICKAVDMEKVMWSGNPLNPIYIIGKNGKGVLCTMRPPTK